MTLRVLRLITRLNVGGPSTHVVVADGGLRRLGWETLLVHGQVEPDEAEIDLRAVDLPRIRVESMARPIRPSADARSFVEIVKIIRRYRPHVIHTHLSKAGLLGRAAAMASSSAQRIHTFHGTLFGGYFGPWTTAGILRAERFLGSRTSRVIALSERQRSELLAHRIAPADRIRIVPLGLDLERFAGPDRERARIALGIPAQVPVVIAVGRLVAIKRLDRLIRAFAAVCSDFPSARLYLVGDGAERGSLEALTRTMGLEDSVRFVGWSIDTPGWYAAADVVALTSDREGTPLALIEAAAAGRAVVATDVGGVADVVADQETGFIVPRTSEDALRERLAQLVANPALRARFGAAAPRRAQQFSADRLITDLDSLYREALMDRRPGA